MTCNGFNVLLAQAAAPMQQDPTGQMIKLVGMAAVFIVVMWFMTIAPQRRKAKEQEKMLNGMRAGDKVVTASGILGVILSIKDKSLSIRSAETKLEILKSAVVEVTERSGEASETKS